MKQQKEKKREGEKQQHSRAYDFHSYHNTVIYWNVHYYYQQMITQKIIAAYCAELHSYSLNQCYFLDFHQL
jgi:hypothetical protein